MTPSNWTMGLLILIYYLRWWYCLLWRRAYTLFLSICCWWLLLAVDVYFLHLYIDSSLNILRYVPSYQLPFVIFLTKCVLFCRPTYWSTRDGWRKPHWWHCLFEQWVSTCVVYRYTTLFDYDIGIRWVYRVIRECFHPSAWTLSWYICAHTAYARWRWVTLFRDTTVEFEVQYSHLDLFLVSHVTREATTQTQGYGAK